jgi:hypothetical protein
VIEIPYFQLLRRTPGSHFWPLFLSHSLSHPSVNSTELLFKIPRLRPLLTTAAATIQWSQHLLFLGLRHLLPNSFCLYLCPSMVYLSSVVRELPYKNQVSPLVKHQIRALFCPSAWNGFPAGLCTKVIVLTMAYKAIWESPYLLLLLFLLLLLPHWASCCSSAHHTCYHLKESMFQMLMCLGHSNKVAKFLILSSLIVL